LLLCRTISRAATSTLQAALDACRPLSTVLNFLEAAGAEKLLEDPLVAVATAEIESRDRPRHAIQDDLRRKEGARKTLAKTYAKAGTCEPDDILDAIYSFSDNNTYLLFNRDPVERMIGFLKKFFSPKDDSDFSLAIQTGAMPCNCSACTGDQYA
jgi:Protein of unknown function (DUF2009)